MTDDWKYYFPDEWEYSHVPLDDPRVVPPPRIPPPQPTR